MTEFDNLKNSYIASIRSGMVAGLSCEAEKTGNEVLSYFCKLLIKNSSYQDLEKDRMEKEIDLLKRSVDVEIEMAYKK